MINNLLHVWTVFYLLIYFNCLKWTSYRSVLMFIWSLIFIKSLIFLYYINNLINTLNTYLNGLSESIEPVNLLLIFREKKEKIKSAVLVESLGKLSLQLSNLLPSPKSPHEYLESFDTFFSIDTDGTTSWPLDTVYCRSVSMDLKDFLSQFWSWSVVLLLSKGQDQESQCLFVFILLLFIIIYVLIIEEQRDWKL